MKAQNGLQTWLTLMALTMLISRSVSGGESPPDLIKGETKGVDRKQTYNLGATGLRGWIYSRPATHFDGLQGRTTALSRQILVTHVAVKSPADGVMQVDDVILGVGGKPFSDDARKSIAAAIQEAEKESNAGVLKLTRWRTGKTEEVQLTLRVMGTYSETAPYECPKSKKIFEEACKALEKEPLVENWHGAISGLALLATGKPEYLPRLQEFARKIGPKSLKLELKPGMVTWEWSYKALFLCEYYLLTGDKEVLPAVTEYTVALSKGQSLYGTFGHGIAPPSPEGKLHGSIEPYGPVNMAGLPANLAIVMGKKCGVKDPEVDPAIERAMVFFGYFVDKGAIPYGEHEPWPYHENNGKNSLCAVMFALQPGQERAAQFFAKMATAGYRSRECGHTGQGFSYLWSALGANAGGPAAAAAFFKEASWHLDLVRRCDGSFTYDGGEQYGPGRTEDNTYYGKSSYYGLSPNATYVLTYAMPLKKICITGRDVNEANWLSQKEAADAIASGRFDLDRLHKSPQELVAAFSDWSPIVRSWAAEELAKRSEVKAMVPQLIAMAEGKDAHVIQGACETLGNLKSVDALATLVRLLPHPDRWVRYKAAQAIRKMGGAAKPVLPDILQALARTAEPLQPINWADPIQIAHGQLAGAVFQGPLTAALKDADPKLLFPAIRSVANNPDGMARATLRNFFESRLTLEDVQALAPEIFAAVKTRCPADTMFGNEIRMGGFKALTKYHFKEGIEAAVIFAKTQGGHGSENRTGEIMKALVTYGSAARETIPALKELIADFNAQVKRNEFPGGELNSRRVNAVEEAIKAIEAAKDQPQLRSIASPPQKIGPGK
jgi:HEAT repeat protein